MRKLIIWYNSSKNVYYHRLVNGSYLEQDYSIGSLNSYGHRIVHIVDDFDFYKKRVPFKKKLVNKTISYLQKF